MTKYVFFEGWAMEELLEARAKGKIEELLKKYNLPYKEYAYGETPISFEFEEGKIGYRGNLKRAKLSGRVRAHVNLGLVLLELLQDGEYKLYESNTPGYTSEELSQRYAIQQLLEKVSEEELNKIKEEIKEKLRNIMIIEKETDTAKPFPSPQIVDYDKVFDEEYLTPKEVAEKLRVSEKTVLKWLNSGYLKGLKIGGVWRIPESEYRHLLLGLKNWDEWVTKDIDEED
jgi:excisionase family DNA binding protein